jgi:hypothetical protein
MHLYVYPCKRLNQIACSKYGARRTLQVGPFNPYRECGRSRERSPEHSPNAGTQP